MQVQRMNPAARTRYLFLVKVMCPDGRRIYEVRQYACAVDAVIDTMLRYRGDWPIAVRPLGGAL